MLALLVTNVTRTKTSDESFDSGRWPLSVVLSRWTFGYFVNSRGARGPHMTKPGGLILAESMG